MKIKVHFMTLGCSKNDIDTENMIFLLNKDVYEVEENLYNSDIVVLNTCSFILDAKTQSIDTIFELVKLKEEGIIKKIIVAGCLGQRYYNDLINDIPEIDSIVGTGDVDKINDSIKSALDGERLVFVKNVHSPYPENTKRVDFRTTQYVKISEGCNNGCNYCIIPRLRGKMRSRYIEDIVNEVRYLVKNGTKEIILIAQNTTEYGKDLYNRPMLHVLLNELSNIENLVWIRILYMYPEGFYKELIHAIKTLDKVAKYVDIPLQHISDKVLKAMGRKTNQESIIKLLTDLRDNISDIIIRTTFIVGFYNETEEDFEELYNFIKNYQFDKLGVFCYSLEESTPAYKYGDNISEETKIERKDKIMKLQAEISKKKLEKNINHIFNVIVEEENENYYVGRSYMDAPGIDGNVFISKNVELKVGKYYNIVIKKSDIYDLYGEYYDEFTK